jgi:hypothetical protein
MSRDIFDDRHDFSAAREAFVTKEKPASTPARLARHRPVAAVVEEARTEIAS